MWAINVLNQNQNILQLKKSIKNSYKIDLIIILVDSRRRFGTTRIENITNKIIDSFIDTIQKHKDLNMKGKNILTDTEKSFLIGINNLMDKYRGGINGSNLTRFNNWMEILENSLPQNELDPKRVATRQERELIWWKQDKKCKICGEPCDLDDTDTDHILEHTLGGSSKIEDGNFQVVHKICHKEKTKNFMRKDESMC